MQLVCSQYAVLEVKHTYVKTTLSNWVRIGLKGSYKPGYPGLEMHSTEQFNIKHIPFLGSVSAKHAKLMLSRHLHGPANRTKNHFPFSFPQSHEYLYTSKTRNKSRSPNLSVTTSPDAFLLNWHARLICILKKKTLPCWMATDWAVAIPLVAGCLRPCFKKTHQIAIAFFMCHSKNKSCLCRVIWIGRNCGLRLPYETWDTVTCS